MSVPEGHNHLINFLFFFKSTSKDVYHVFMNFTQLTMISISNSLLDRELLMFPGNFQAWRFKPNVQPANGREACVNLL